MKNKSVYKKMIITIISTLFGLMVIIIGICYFLVTHNASERTFDTIADVQSNKYGLILGTSPITPQGDHNINFDNRIKAAVELYKAGKINYIIVSGGNYTQNNKFGCDEPNAMLKSLVACGIPVDKIILDYEGTRTLNSIAKVKEVYHLDSLTLISQKYHNERAIYLADKYDISTVGYNAEPSNILSNRIKNTLREYLARVKLFIDLFKGIKPSFITKANTYHEDNLEEWINEPESIRGITGALAHISYADSELGVVKYFSTMNNHPFYYNSRHGFFVLLPEGMGYNQQGENIMGAHGNEFYNNDTTLVVIVGGMFYDIVLDDVPHYADTLKHLEKDFLTKMGKHTIQNLSPYTLVSKGRINHTDSTNPPADRFIRKWLLKKDISNRECHMELTIYFNDSLNYRIKEFENIINQFPDIPKSLIK